MATTVPSDIGEFETEGKKAFYKFLEGVAKPDAWHDRSQIFILEFAKHTGVIPKKVGPFQRPA